MVAIPGGSFTMGSPESEKGSTDKERPQHNVAVSPFFMGKYPASSYSGLISTKTPGLIEYYN